MWVSDWVASASSHAVRSKLGGLRPSNGTRIVSRASGAAAK